MNLEAPRFSMQANEAEPDSDREILNLIRLGRWDGALGMRDDDWFREHASDPELRKAILEGVFLCAGSKLEKKSEQVRRLVGIDDEELRSPAARATAIKRAASQLEGGNTPALLAIHRLIGLDASFFTETNLTSLARGVVERAVREYTDNYRLFADLSAMPVPAQFYKRPEVAEAARVVQMRALAEGRPDAVAVMRHIGMDARTLTAPEVMESARTGAWKLADAGETRALLEYAAAFGIRTSSIHVENVKNGLLKLLRAGNTEAARAFTRAFPHLDEQAVLKSMPTGLVREGLVAQVTKGDLNAADAFIAYANISLEDRDTGLEAAILALLNTATEQTIQEIMERWHLPASLLKDQGAHYIARVPWKQRGPMEAWHEAVRVKRLARVSQARFEDAFLKGISHMGDNPIEHHGPYPANGEIEERIRDIKAYLTKIPDRAFAGRAERVLAQRLAQTQFRRGDTFYLRAVQEQFPFLDDASMRRSAVRAVEHLVMQGQVPSVVLREINAWLREKKLPLVAWNDVAREAYPWAAKVLRAGGFEEYFGVAVDGLGIPADAREQLIKETRADVQTTILTTLPLGVPGNELTRQAYFETYGFTWETFPFKNIPLRYLLESEDPSVIERRNANPWSAALVALEKIQARSKREEYDPWINELFPMVTEAERAGVLDREAESDGQLLVDYVKTFGMLNLKETSRIYFRLKKGSFETLPEEDRKLLVELIGPKAARLEREHLINELRKLRFDMQHELLADKIPRKVGTALGLEAFNAIIGESQWTEENDKPEELLALWKETASRSRLVAQRLENEAIRAIADQDDAAAEAAYAKADAERERVEVARGYEEVAFTVNKASRNKEREEEARNEIENVSGNMDRAIVDLRAAAPYVRHTIRGVRFAALEDRSNLNEDPIAELSYLFEDLPQKDPGALILDTGRLETLLSSGDDKPLVDLMEEVVSKGGSNNVLRALSFVHLARVAPRPWTDHLSKEDFPTAAAELGHRAAFVAQYVREHYLNPAQESIHTGHAPFSETLLQALERVWHVVPILAADARIRQLRDQAKGISKETTDVTLVPVHGMLRTYGGDLADACYTSKHRELANGEFPRVKALAFVTNRNKSKERIAGSVLFVETTWFKNGERVLVVRANNPRQNLIMQVDSAALVRKTIDAAIATAKRRGIKHVGIVRDGSSQASSNRPEVSDAYAEEYADREIIELADEPETNFNGYPIWDPDSGSPTVLVWTNDDPNAT